MLVLWRLGSTVRYCGARIYVLLSLDYLCYRILNGKALQEF
jgi:hypothetical protein